MVLIIKIKVKNQKDCQMEKNNLFIQINLKMILKDLNKDPIYSKDIMQNLM